MKILKTIFIALFLISNGYASSNMGHRAGAGPDEFYKDLPENSIIALKASLQGLEEREILQNREKFKYLEYDVQETKDHHIVVFHDKTIQRMIPWDKNEDALMNIYEELSDNDQFVANFGSLAIKDLTLKQIKTLRLTGNYDQTIPTIKEFLQAAKSYGLRKPLVTEIKYFYTYEAKKRLLDTIRTFKETYLNHTNLVIERGFDFPEVAAFLSFPKKFKLFKKYIGKKNTCSMFREYGFKGVFMPFIHFKNLCK